MINGWRPQLRIRSKQPTTTTAAATTTAPTPPTTTPPPPPTTTTTAAATTTTATLQQKLNVHMGNKKQLVFATFGSVNNGTQALDFCFLINRLW